MALNTWAAKNLGPDADISRMPGSGGGGGGSSDFSTAEVTLNLTVEGKTITAEGLKEVYLDFPSQNEPYQAGYIIAENHVLSVVMYQGTATAYGLVARVVGEEYTDIVGVPTTTGDVTWNTENSCFVITGNGTITATLDGTIG